MCVLRGSDSSIFVYTNPTLSLLTLLQFVMLRPFWHFYKIETTLFGISTHLRNFPLFTGVNITGTDNIVTLESLLL